MCSITTSVVSLPYIVSIYKKKENVMIDVVEYGVPYLIMPVIGLYVVYEFVKMLILNNRDKKNGKS